MAASPHPHPQQFCLRWNNHQSNIISVFEQLLHTEAFVDVTLAVEGLSLKAHKVVLSACSPYFQGVLESHPDKHPIIILKDVRYVDMRDLLDFMYRGEVSVDQDNLSGFLRVAESLRIKGLTEVNEKRFDNSSTVFAATGSSQDPRISPETTTLSSTVFSYAGQSQNPHTSSPLTLSHGITSTTSLHSDVSNSTHKRMSHSPSESSKKRRGRPPKISGEDSEGEPSLWIGPSTTPSGERLEVDQSSVKIEVDDEISKEDGDGKHEKTKNEAGSTWDPQSKENLRIPKDEPDHSNDLRQSPSSGQGTTAKSWPSSEYTSTETHTHIPPPPQPGLTSPNLSIDLTLPRPPLNFSPKSSLVTSALSAVQSQHLPPSMSNIDQLYYTKNLLEAAMLKNPYDALKNDKHLHGSILLASLRTPLKYGLQSMYNDRPFFDRDLIDSSSAYSPRKSPKPSQSKSPSSRSGTHSVTNSSYSNSNGSTGKGVSVPIMSYCIQDNGFKCSKCFQTFTHPSNFHRHYITVHTDRRAHKCHVCGKEFKRKDNMMSHIRSVHRPGKEGHSIYRDLSAVSPTLSRRSPLLTLPDPISQSIKVDKHSVNSEPMTMQ